MNYLITGIVAGMACFVNLPLAVLVVISGLILGGKQ